MPSDLKPSEIAGAQALLEHLIEYREQAKEGVMQRKCHDQNLIAVHGEARGVINTYAFLASVIERAEKIAKGELQ